MTICNFEVGDLVRCNLTEDIGVVQKVDKEYYGARQAFKVYGAKRGQAIHGGMVNGNFVTLPTWRLTCHGTEPSLVHTVGNEDTTSGVAPS